jgi:NAD(P)-dependent dehydrogenase (short-subunit alcohol dehydrogenase family)
MAAALLGSCQPAARHRQGGSRGIGLGICEVLGSEGCELVIADISEDRMQEAVSHFSARGYQCKAVRVDVTDEESVVAFQKQLRTTGDQVDILVNSAGVAPNIVPTIRLSSSEWRRVLDVNLFGVFLCCREIGTIMVRQGHGSVINIASLNAVSPAALCAAYNVAKAGVVSLTQSLAVELASCGVRVNAISPGPVETEFHDVVMPQRAATLGVTREEMVERVRKSIPLGRWGRPSDVAQAALFLASEHSQWITGQNLIVAGGLSGVAASPSKETMLESLAKPE